MTPAPATHVIRVLGLVGSADEMYALQRLIELGGNDAKKLLTRKLEAVAQALSTFCGITVVQDAPASTSYSTGTEITTLATYIGSHEQGEDTNLSIYPTSTGSVRDTGYN